MANTYPVAQESYSKTKLQLKICGNSYKDTDSPFAWSGHMVRNKLCWDANNAVGLPKQRKAGLDWYEFLVLKVPLCYLRPSIIYSVPWWPDCAKGHLRKTDKTCELVNYDDLCIFQHLRPQNNTRSFVNEAKPFHKFSVKNVSTEKQYWLGLKSLLKHI